MVDQARARKLGGRVAQIVAEMLDRRIKDPRLGFVTITAARLTGDLREATVFYTVYGTPEEMAGTAAALASATGVIRSEIGRQTGLKHTPSLEFRLDAIPDNARNIEELVARAREADAALAVVREGAEPAGDADPYRVPPVAGDLDDDDEDDELDDEDELDDDDELDEFDDLDDLGGAGDRTGPAGTSDTGRPAGAGNGAGTVDDLAESPASADQRAR
jgi:ribosome-binding factor A